MAAAAAGPALADSAAGAASAGRAAGIRSAGVPGCEVTGPVLVIPAARATSASNPAGPSNTAVVPGDCIGANPSHLLVAASLTRLTKRWPRMTKAANPFWVRGLEGIRPVVLDRIPRRMRTQSTAGSGRAAGHDRVLLADGWLPLQEPVDCCLTAQPEGGGIGDAARAREHQDTAGALVGRIDTAGQEGARGQLVINRARIGGSRNIRDQVQHPGHPPSEQRQ